MFIVEIRQLKLLKPMNCYKEAFTFVSFSEKFVELT